MFSLFLNRVDEDRKCRITSRLLMMKRPESHPLNKPAVVCSSEETQLEHLIGPESWLLFTVLCTNSDWLLQSPDTWTQFESFLEMKKFVRTLKVVNDGSERGVKLIQDFRCVITTNPMGGLVMLGS